MIILLYYLCNYKSTCLQKHQLQQLPSQNLQHQDYQVQSVCHHGSHFWCQQHLSYWKSDQFQQQYVNTARSIIGKSTEEQITIIKATRTITANLTADDITNVINTNKVTKVAPTTHYAERKTVGKKRREQTAEQRSSLWTFISVHISRECGKMCVARASNSTAVTHSPVRNVGKQSTDGTAFVTQQTIIFCSIYKILFIPGKKKKETSNLHHVHWHCSTGQR